MPKCAMSAVRKSAIESWSLYSSSHAIELVAQCIATLDFDTARQVVVLGCVVEYVHTKYRPLSQGAECPKPGRCSASSVKLWTVRLFEQRRPERLKKRLGGLLGPQS